MWCSGIEKKFFFMSNPSSFFVVWIKNICFSRNVFFFCACMLFLWIFCIYWTHYVFFQYLGFTTFLLDQGLLCSPNLMSCMSVSYFICIFPHSPSFNKVQYFIGHLIFFLEVVPYWFQNISSNCDHNRIHNIQLLFYI